MELEPNQPQIEPQLPKIHVWVEQDEEDKEEEAGVGLVTRHSHSKRRINGVATTPSSVISESEPEPVLFPTNGLASSEHSDQEEVEQEVAADNSQQNGLMKDEIEEVKVVKEGNGISNTVYFDQLQGTEPINGVSEIQSEITKSLAPVEHLYEEIDESINHSDHATKVDADVDLIGEIEENLVELDVERVLEKQNTHDLYCPNCKSCITRRVILRRRKPKIPHVRPKPKPVKKLEPFLTSVAARGSGGTTEIEENVNPTPAPLVQNTNAEQEQEAFSCLSCLSLFIPIGNGCFKMFNFFKNGRKQNESTQSAQEIRQREHVQSPQQTSQREEIGGSQKIKQNEITQSPQQTSQMKEIGGSKKIKQNEITQSPREIKQNEITQSPREIKQNEIRQSPREINQNEITQSSQVISQNMNIESPPKVSQNEDTKSPSKMGQNEDEQSPHDEVTGIPWHTGHNENAQNSEHTSHYETKSPQTISSNEATQSHQNINQNKSKQRPQKMPGDKINWIFSIFPFHKGKATVAKVQGAAVLVTNREHADDAVMKSKKPGIVVGENEIQDLEVGLLEPELPPRAEVAPSSQISTQNEHIGADAGEARDWEILKSIVYGGLIESITSLGVVSSAAGAGASTLNVLVLGMANLIGGLLLILHNLRELKKEQPHRTSTEINNEEDRYQVLLGRRQNFVLHTFVVILSFLIFGLVPPVVYGFSFRKSDDKDLKLAAVAGASLVCIFLLALGKGHVRRPQRTYVSTVSYYVALGILASGISFVVGELLRKLLIQLGVFDSTSPVSMPFLGTIPLDVGRSAY